MNNKNIDIGDIVGFVNEDNEYLIGRIIGQNPYTYEFEIEVEGMGIYNELPFYLEKIEKFEEKTKNPEDILEATSEILKLRCILIYLSNDKYAVHIKVGGIEVGIGNTSLLIPVIESEIKEIGKFLNGEPNTWE
jgi:hypothetical protein